MRKAKYFLYAAIILLGCNKSNDPLSGANTGKCLLTGITSGGSTPLTCTISYNSTRIANVNCENANRTNDTYRNYDYTYSNNIISIRQTVTDANGSSTSKTYDISLQNQLPVQVSINGNLSQKLFYDNSKLVYYRTYINNIDSVVLVYDAQNENIVSRVGYTWSGSSWITFSNINYAFDTNINPLNSLFLIEETFGDNTIGVKYFNKNNIISSGTSNTTYSYNSNNLPTQVSQPSAVTKYYSYQCP